MKRFYSQFRILILTLALGLAGVWMWNGWTSADFVTVDLPKTQSADVIEVFGAEKRWLELSEGSHYRAGLIMLESSVTSEMEKLTFVLQHYADERPSFVNIRRTTDPNIIDISPYLLECRDGIRNVILARSADNSHGFISKRQVRDLMFQVEKPSVSGVCQIYVGIADSSEDAQNMLFLDPRKIEDGRGFWNNVRDFRRLRFINKLN